MSMSLLSSCPGSLDTKTRHHPILPRRVRLVALLAVLLAGFAPALRAAEDPELSQAFWKFFRVKLDTSRSAPVQNLTIQRDGMKLKLTSGRLWLAKALLDRTTGAYFIGEGTVSLTANGLVGNQMLRSTLKGENFGSAFPGRIPTEVILRPRAGEKQFTEFRAKVSEVFFRFSDGLEEQIELLMEESGGDDAAAAASQFKKRSERFFHVLPGQIPNIHLENHFLVQVHNDIDDYAFFVAEFKLGPEWLTYANAGGADEEIWIGTRPSQGAGVWQDPLTWTGYHQSEDYDKSGHLDVDVELDSKALLDLSKVEMAIGLPTTLSLVIDARITFTPLVHELSLVPFDLINNFGYAWNDEGGRPVTVQSVTDEAGHDLSFLHQRDKLLVRLATPASPGQAITLRFKVDEQTIIQIGDQSWQVVNTYPWFPQHGYLGGRYATDWTIRIKKPLTAIASGDLVETREEKGMTVTRWVHDEDVAFPSFIFGRFQSREGTYKSQSGKTITIGVHANPLGDLRGTTKSKSILEESKNILKLFEELYGPYPYTRLDITQMAPFSGFGQAPPGILFLTGDAFLPASTVADLQSRASQRLRDQGAGSEGLMRSPYYHDFFAHELGHQWWAHRVLWGRDEDQWLSEAFTEYASALYAMQIDGEGKFQEKLKAWRQNARESDKCGFPIAGATLFRHKTARVAGKCRINLIYNKGAYVVHMLRMTIGHEKYVQAMKNFLEKYDGKLVTTQMLVKEVEEVVGGSMDWFFDQWFYTSGMPTFRFSYTTEKSEDGSFLLTGRIVQDDPENFKQVLMPVFYDLGGKNPVIRNQAVLKVDHEFQVKLPSKPKRVWLDGFNTVLGTIVTE